MGKVYQASNGQDALEFVKKSMQNGNKHEALDIILMDLNMPIMDGYTACEKIIKFYNTINENAKFDKQMKAHTELLEAQAHIWIKELNDSFNLLQESLPSDIDFSDND